MPTRPNYTGVRQERYETLRASRRQISREAYESAIRELNTQERRIINQRERRNRQYEERDRLRRIEEARQEAIREEARRQRAQQARQRANERRRQKRMLERQQRENERIIIDRTKRGGWTEQEYDDVIFPSLNNNLRRLVGVGSAYAHITVNGTILRRKLFKPQGGDAMAIYYNDIFRLIYDGGSDQQYNSLVYDNDLVRYKKDDVVRIVIMKSSVIPRGNVLQKYLNGVKHCVLEPLIMLWSTMAKNSKTSASMKRCQQVARRLHNLKETYPNGVPEGLDMEAVARVAHRCLILHDILGNEITRYNAKSNKNFYFTNTRINHLEQGRLTLDKQYERVTPEKMAEILHTHDRDNVFYLYAGDIMSNRCRSLRSVRGCWAVYNDDYDLFQEFNEQTGVDNYGIDALKHPQLNEFILESRIINSAPTPLCDQPNNLDDVKHIDLEKAYTQHSLAPFYKGFLGHITDFVQIRGYISEAHVLANLGIYKFLVLNEPCELLKTLGIFKGNFYTLPSPEIEYMMSLGLNVEFRAGCYGSTFHIEYTEEMLKNRRYCIWAGKLGMDHADNTYTFKGDSEWARCLRNILGEDKVYHYEDLEMVTVNVPKKGYKTRHHILSFITSYTRINMLELMRKVDGELVKVVLDGLYYRGELPDSVLPTHKAKKNISHIGFREHWYYPTTTNTSDWEYRYINDHQQFIKNIIVLTGAGGTGKSHSILTRKGIPKILYVAPTNVLGRKMREKYDVEYTTIHKLIGMEEGDYKCRPYKEDHKEPPVVFIDELTMIEKSWIDKALQMYPNTLFYIAGDVDENRWYQCRNGHPGAFSKIWLPTKYHYQIHYSTDYRAKDCFHLRLLKQFIREKMKEIFIDGGQVDSNRLSRYVLDYMKQYIPNSVLEFKDAVAQFKPGDIWVAGTHKTNDKLLENNIVSGYINRKKEILTQDEDGAIIRGSFTTHSLQGLTFERETLYISLDFFEYAMLYTSISRACTIKQIKIVV